MKVPIIFYSAKLAGNAFVLIDVNIQDAHRVGETSPLLPASDDNDGIASADESSRLAEIDAILDSSIHILNPISNTTL